MTGRLLFVIFMFYIHEVKVQATPPPKLTVSPAVIAETDSVTLSCEAPSSVSVSQCHFYTLSGGTVSVLPCYHTLTGTELLKMARLSSPAEVKVRCLCIVQPGDEKSSYSDLSSITIQATPPPKLKVSPAVIAETDSVTLSCEASSSVSVSQCHFFTLSGGTVSVLPCYHTLTGTELLKMASLSSPAEVKVSCLCIVQPGDEKSSYSDLSSITIQTSYPPKLTVSPAVTTETYPPTYRNLPSIAIQTSHPPKLTVSPAVTTETNPPTYSNLPSIAIQSSTLDNSTKGTSLRVTPEKKASSTWLFKTVVVMTGYGAAMGIFLLIIALRMTQKKKAGSVEENGQEAQNDNFDMPHIYDTIPEEPAASFRVNIFYSDVKTL